MATIYYEPSGCNCDGQDYTSEDISNAANAALKLASEGKTSGNDKYPHTYNDYEHFSFQHASAPYIEFPVFPNGETYNGQSPGADRVVLGSIATDFQSAVYCAVITHDGQKKNGFAECQDDTTNPAGKGDFKKRKEHRKKHHAPEGRKLLKHLVLN